MLLNNALETAFPEAYAELSREEMAGLTILGNGELKALSDAGKHLVITIGWKKLGGFTGMLLNSTDLKNKMVRDIRKRLSKLKYREDGFLALEVGGLAADGFRYRYCTVDGTEMTAESYVLKRGHDLYYFHFYSRSELAAENSEEVRAIFKKAQWTDGK